MNDAGSHAPALFLSYAREDAASARRIAEALRAQGMEVWFDENELRGGDSWDAKIRKQIRECTLFIALISARTQARHEGYFRREWKLAVERTADMAASVAFLIPVVIDDTREADALVPEEFMRVQWTRLPGALPTPDFVAQVQRLATSPRVSNFGAARPRAVVQQSDSATPQGKLKPPLKWALAAGALAFASGAVFYVMKPVPQAPAAAAAETKPASTPAKSAAHVPALSTDKSIAVLPFANMSDDKDNAFFTDGVHEDILTNLALIREFRVVSRTSVMPFRGSSKSVKQIAQELGVTFILEGSVRRSGNKVRVTGQLIHAATDEHVWAQSYDRDLSDVFTIQSELSQQIAAALKTALSPEEKTFLTRRPTNNAEAYDRLLQARAIANRDGNGRRARQERAQLLREAVTLDPQFAVAWGELAAALAYGVFFGDPDMESQLAKAREAIAQAEAIAPGDPDVISSVATYHYYAFRDYPRAIEHLQRLAQLTPNSARFYGSLAFVQRRQGRWADSTANLRRAIELDPSSRNNLVALVENLRAGRRWSEAQEVQRRLVAIGDSSPGERYALGFLSFLESGSTAEMEKVVTGLTPAQRTTREGFLVLFAWAEDRGDFAETFRLESEHPDWTYLGFPPWEAAYARAFRRHVVGDRAGVREALGDHPERLREMVRQAPGNFRQMIFLAAIEALLGNREEACRLADRACELLPISRDAVWGSTYAFYRALIYDLSGDKETALAEYRRLLQFPVAEPLMKARMMASPGFFTNLRGDPRFEAMIADPKNNAPLF